MNLLYLNLIYSFTELCRMSITEVLLMLLFQMVLGLFALGFYFLGLSRFGGHSFGYTGSSGYASYVYPVYGGSYFPYYKKCHIKVDTGPDTSMKSGEVEPKTCMMPDEVYPHMMAEQNTEDLPRQNSAPEWMYL